MRILFFIAEMFKYMSVQIGLPQKAQYYTERPNPNIIYTPMVDPLTIR